MTPADTTACIYCGKPPDADCHQPRAALGGAPRMNSHAYVAPLAAACRALAACRAVDARPPVAGLDKETSAHVQRIVEDFREDLRTLAAPAPDAAPTADPVKLVNVGELITSTCRERDILAAALSRILRAAEQAPRGSTAWREVFAALAETDEATAILRGLRSHGRQA